MSTVVDGNQQAHQYLGFAQVVQRGGAAPHDEDARTSTSNDDEISLSLASPWA